MRSPTHIAYIPTLPARSNPAYPTSPGGRRYIDFFARLHKDEIKVALDFWAGSSPKGESYAIGLRGIDVSEDYSLYLLAVYPKERYFTSEGKHNSPDLDCKLTQDAIFEYIVQNDVKVVHRTEEKIPDSETNLLPGIYVALTPGMCRDIPGWDSLRELAIYFMSNIVRSEYTIICRTPARKQLSVSHHVVQYVLVSGNPTVTLIGHNPTYDIVAKLSYPDTKVVTIAKTMDIQEPVGNIPGTAKITNRSWGSLSKYKHLILVGKGKVYQVDGNIPDIPVVTRIS